MNPELFQAMTADPVTFRQHLLIETNDGPRPLAQVADDWQLDDFAALDNSMRVVAGLQPDATRPTYLRIWIERARGHAKSNDLAAACIFMLLGQRTIDGRCAAADRDQSKLIRDAIDRLTRINPWLTDILEVNSYRVLNRATGSALEIISNDAPGSYGATPDFILVDELTHWAKRDLWDSLLSAAAKKANCLLAVITNAGVIDSWQWKTRQIVTTDVAWRFSRLDGPVASWISQEALAEQRRLLPPKVYQRLWLNEWVTGSGDALNEEDITAAIVHDGPALEWNEDHMPYIASLDIGVRSDRSALVTFGLCLRGGTKACLRVIDVQSWDPRDYGGRVPLQLVQDAIVELNHRYRGVVTCYDPSQAEYLAEVVSSEVVMMRVPWTAPLKMQFALTLIEAFRERLVELYDCPELLRDLRSISIAERAGRWTLILPRSNEHGHCDVGAAFVQGLLFALHTRRDFLGLHDKIETEPNSFSLSHI